MRVGQRNNPSTTISIGLAMVMTPLLRPPFAFPPEEPPTTTRPPRDDNGNPHPAKAIGKEGNADDADDPASLLLSSPAPPSSRATVCFIVFVLELLMGEAWMCCLAGTLRGSRGFRVWGRSWVNGRSRDVCLTCFCCCCCVSRKEESECSSEMGKIGGRAYFCCACLSRKVRGKRDIHIYGVSIYDGVHCVRHLS